MAYTVVPIVVTGDLWTAANHNTYIRDNFAAGVPDLFALPGDIAVATAADMAVRLGRGLAGEILTRDDVQSTGISWQDPYNVTYPARARRTSAQTINSGVATIIAFDTAYFDPKGRLTLGAAAKYTASVPGYYQVTAMALLDCGADADNPETFLLALYQNGGFFGTMDYVIPEGTPTGWKITLKGSDAVFMGITGYVDVRITQGSGVGLSLEQATMVVHRIG